MKKLYGVLLVLIMMAVALSSAPKAQAAGLPGFNPNYLDGYATNLLTNANWTTANKAKMKEEIVCMASMGTKLVRLMVWPWATSWSMSQNGGSTFGAEMDQIAINMPELIGMYQAEGIQCIVAFANDYLSGGPNPTQWTKWWEWAYGTGDTNFNRFLTDTTTWARKFVDRIEASPYAANVKWYDIQNECSSHWYPAGANYDKTRWYAAHLWDWANMPAAKKGFSINTDYINDFNYMKAWFTSRPCKMVDFHAYPASTSDSMYNVDTNYQNIKNLIPTGWGATLILGEFGHQTNSEADELLSDQLIGGMIAKAQTKGIPYQLGWCFNPLSTYGQPAGPDSHYFSFGKEWTSEPWNNPCDHKGTWADKYDKCYNSDMEIYNAQYQKPDGWGWWSNSGTATGGSGGSYTDSAAGDSYLRIQSNVLGDDFCTLTPWIDVSGGGKFYINAFIRSNCQDLYMCFHEYDANWNWLNFQAGPVIQTPGWKWTNYQRTLSSAYTPTLNANTRHIIGAVSGHVPLTEPYGIIDMDCSSWFAQ